MDRPKRIQLSRAKGWRMPPDTVKVSRPGVFGNPFTAAQCREAGYRGTDGAIAARCVEAFRVWADTPYWRNNWDSPESEEKRAALLSSLPRLRGKNLACWCRIVDTHGNYMPCHADVLLSLANGMTCEEVRDENLRWAKGEEAQ